MKILVACEESQAVTIELRRLGHEAYSCDIIECSGGHPEWHIMQDVLPLLNGNCDFFTRDRDGMGVSSHHIHGKWDMIIAFPPCTDLANSGARHFVEKRKDGRQQRSIEFFCNFLSADCEKIAVENPVGIIGGRYIPKHFPKLAIAHYLPVKPTQIIQPWQFGHGETKATCLWLKGLPNLKPTEIVEGREQRVWKMPPSADRAKLRSKTFPGIAKAMAEQWAGDIRGDQNA